MKKRNPFQVQVVVYRRGSANEIHVLVLRRTEERGGFWQPVTGGVERGEEFAEAAARETQEETGLRNPDGLRDLNFVRTLPLDEQYLHLYDPGVTELGEHAFGFESPTETIVIDHQEHVEYRWVSVEDALKLFKYEGNKEAVRTLARKLVD